MIATAVSKKVDYKTYMENQKFQRDVWDSIDRQMALGLFAFLYREGRDLDDRWFKLHKYFEFTTTDEEPGKLSIRGRLDFELHPDEFGMDDE